MEHLDYSKILEKIGADKDISKLTEEELLFYDMVKAIRSRSADEEKLIIQQALKQFKQNNTQMNLKTNENQNNMKTNNKTWIGIAAGVAVLIAAYFFLRQPSKTIDEIYSQSFKPTKEYVSIAEEKAKQYGMADSNAASRDSFLKALSFYQNNQYDEAMKILGPYISIYPDDDLARFHLALCQMYRERYSPALENLSILNAKTDLEFSPDVKWNLALCYLKMVDGKKQAKVLFQQLIASQDKYSNEAKANLDYLK